MRWLARHSFALAVTALGAVIVVAGAFLLAVALPELVNGGPTGAGASAKPSPSGSPALGVMTWVEMPADADCSACHLTAGGGIGLKNVPAMAHPLKGWNQCAACHAPDRLVAVAPGHSGIHATECLTCHQPASLPAPLSRPHRDRQNQDCLECHGGPAPLPEDMAHRSESVCWLCHRLPDAQPPVPAHPVERSQTNCLACHEEGGAAGKLPADHAQRTGAECLLCHAPASPSPVPAQPSPTTSPTASPQGRAGPLTGDFTFTLKFALVPPYGAFWLR